MPNLEDVKLGDPTVTDDLTGIPGNEPMVEAEPEQAGVDFSGLKSLLMTPTGGGSITDYVDHPLNFDRSEGLAQVIRGLTGFTDNLALAVVDILVGAFRWKKGRAVADGQVL